MKDTITLRDFYMKDNSYFLENPDDYKSFKVDLEGDTSMCASFYKNERHLWANNGSTAIPFRFCKSFVQLYQMCKAAIKGTKFCDKCGKPIDGRYMFYFASWFHPECLTKSEKEMIERENYE